jgi:CRP/FNR family transcriptional regulator, cyclic AMP receptor protein
LHSKQNSHVMDITTKLTFLEQFPLFETLSLEEKRRLTQMVEFNSLPKHRNVYAPGDRSDKIFFLVRGSIKISAQFGDEREVIKNILHPLAMFGELCIVGEDERSDWASAQNEDIQFFTLRLEDFRSLMANNFAFSNSVLQLIGSKLRRAEGRLESLIFKDARARIIDFLKDSAVHQGRKIGLDEMLVKHSLTQQDIANITGTSRQTVTSVLNDLKKSNLLHFTRRSFLIRDLAKLA